MPTGILILKSRLASDRIFDRSGKLTKDFAFFDIHGDQCDLRGDMGDGAYSTKITNPCIITHPATNATREIIRSPNLGSQT